MVVVEGFASSSSLRLALSLVCRACYCCCLFSFEKMVISHLLHWWRGKGSQVRHILSPLNCFWVSEGLIWKGVLIYCFLSCKYLGTSLFGKLRSIWHQKAIFCLFFLIQFQRSSIKLHDSFALSDLIFFLHFLPVVHPLRFNQVLMYEYWDGLFLHRYELMLLKWVYMLYALSVLALCLPYFYVVFNP